MAGYKSTYQGAGFYASPGIWMSRWLDELWPQIPDKHNDSIYSDLATWMQIDSVGNKFSQAENLSINPADPEKKNAPREGSRTAKGPCVSTPHLSIIHLIHLVAKGHALSRVSCKSSAFCHRKKRKRLPLPWVIYFQEYILNQCWVIGASTDNSRESRWERFLSKPAMSRQGKLGLQFRVWHRHLTYNLDILVEGFRFWERWLLLCTL